MGVYMQVTVLKTSFVELWNSLSQEALKTVWITNVSLYVSIEKGGSFKKRGGEGEVACGDKDG